MFRCGGMHREEAKTPRGWMAFPKHHRYLRALLHRSEQSSPGLFHVFRYACDFPLQPHQEAAHEAVSAPHPHVYLRAFVSLLSSTRARGSTGASRKAPLQCPITASRGQHRAPESSPCLDYDADSGK